MCIFVFLLLAVMASGYLSAFCWKCYQIHMMVITFCFSIDFMTCSYWAVSMMCSQGISAHLLFSFLSKSEEAWWCCLLYQCLGPVTIEFFSCSNQCGSSCFITRCSPFVCIRSGNLVILAIYDSLNQTWKPVVFSKILQVFLHVINFSPTHLKGFYTTETISGIGL